MSTTDLVFTDVKEAQKDSKWYSNVTGKPISDRFAIPSGIITFNFPVVYRNRKGRHVKLYLLHDWVVKWPLKKWENDFPDPCRVRAGSGQIQNSPDGDIPDNWGPLAINPYWEKNKQINTVQPSSSSGVNLCINTEEKPEVDSYSTTAKSDVSLKFYLVGKKTFLKRICDFIQ